METTPTTTETTPSSGLRPTFLTVLCVLTFLGSGWGVIKAVQGYFTADATVAMTNQIIEDTEDKLEGQETPSLVKTILGSVSAHMTADNIRKSSIFSLIANLLTLAGAILMWKLNKTGFYLYVAGGIVAILNPVVVMGPGMLGGISAVWEGFIAVIFIVMYAVNLKHMRK